MCDAMPRKAHAEEEAVIQGIYEDGCAAFATVVRRHSGGRASDAATTGTVLVCREVIAALAWEVGVRNHGMSPGEAVDHFLSMVSDRNDLIACVRRRMT